MSLTVGGIASFYSQSPPRVVEELVHRQSFKSSIVRHSPPSVTNTLSMVAEGNILDEKKDTPKVSLHLEISKVFLTII